MKKVWICTMCHADVLAITPDTLECVNCGARQGSGPVLLGFVHVEPRDAQAIYDWWLNYGGTAALWGDAVPVADLLGPESRRTKSKLEAAMDAGEEGADDAWLSFHDEVVAMAAMVQAAFVARTCGASYCPEHQKLHADGWHEPSGCVIRCCPKHKAILGIRMG